MWVEQRPRLSVMTASPGPAVCVHPQEHRVLVSQVLRLSGSGSDSSGLGPEDAARSLS